jgi:plastocyanin
VEESLSSQKGSLGYTDDYVGSARDDRKHMKKVYYSFALLGALVVLSGCTAKYQEEGTNNKADDSAMMEGEHDGETMEDGDGETMDKTGDGAMEDESNMEAGTVKEFTVTAENFAFSQNEIRVKKGDTVKINFTSTDGFHDWVVDEFDAATERVNTGGTTSVEFVASETGEFSYYCSVGSHRQLGMEGMLIVE